MFSVIQKDTGLLFVVYGINGQYFLIYDEQKCVWVYMLMDLFRPATTEEVQHGNQ